MTAAVLHPGGSPLAGTAQRLSLLDEDVTYRVGQPDEPGWHRFAGLADPDLLTAWHRELAAREGDRRTAAAYLGGWVAAAAVETWALPALAEARLPLAGPAAVSLHRHAEEGWFDAVAAPSPLAVLPGDPAAGQVGTVVVADREALLDLLAERLLTLEVVFDVLGSTLPVGPGALWGGLADSLGGRALWLARLLDSDRDAAWHDAQAITDRLAARQPRLRVRPHPFPVAHSGGEELFQVRGTCCLYYRTVAEPDPDGEGYCGTCPLRTDASRTRRLRAHLDDQPAS